MKPFAILAGLVAPPVYVAAVALGGWLTPGYDHVAHPVGLLVASGAPAKAIIDPIFAVYNVLIIAFARGLRPAFRRAAVSLSLLSPVLLGLAGVLGLVMWLFPMDGPGEPATFGGEAHLWLAGLLSLATMLAVLFTTLSLGRQPHWRRFAGYCLISLAVILVAGAFAALAMARSSPVTGLWERVTIGAFLQWVLVVALALAMQERRVGAAIRA